MTDELGDRIKLNYESRTKVKLPRRTYTIIRLDGKAFHTYTRGFAKPYDNDLMNAMDYTTKMLCENIQGCKLGYVQSDEISLLLTDFDKLTTEAYFDGNVQKITSITASMATAYFNEYMRNNREDIDRLAFFDSRVFTISNPNEVVNYFLWRQNDAVRNSISMTAQSLYSHDDLKFINMSQAQDMCMEKDVNWNDLPDGFKRGRMSIKGEYEESITIKRKDEDEDEVVRVKRNRWVVTPAIWISKKVNKFKQLIPVHDEFKIEID